MNKRLLAYLRSLGLASDATDEQAWDFHNTLRGLQASIANALNYNEADTAARTNCDVMVRALGFDPENPNNLLRMEGVSATVEVMNGRTLPGTSTAGNDGASAAGDLERRLRGEGATLERARVQSIEQLATIAGSPVDLIRQLTADPNITFEQARQRIFEDHQARTRANVALDMPGQNGGVPNGAPAGHSRNSQTDFNRDALACAMMMRFGVNDPTRSWTRWNDQTGAIIRVDRSSDGELCRAADRGHEIGAIPMVELVRRALAVDGITCEPTAGSIGRAIQQRGATGVSNSAMLGIFSQTFGAQMIEGYIATLDTTETWTTTGYNPNFFKNERTRLKAGSALTRHAKGGEAEHVQMGDATEYTKLFRYSGQFVIDDMDLINDTLGALSDATPREMGESAKQIRPDLAYTILKANPTMGDGVALFHSSRGNIIATMPLNKANLQVALNFLATRRENGRNLNIRASNLIVPVSISWDARELVKSSTLVIAGTTDRTLGNYNALSDELLNVISDPRMDNGVTDPATGTTYAGDLNDWYLTTRRAVEVTYLRGSGASPEMRTGVLDRGQFGIWFDVKQDIGANPLRPLEMVQLQG